MKVSINYRNDLGLVDEEYPMVEKVLDLGNTLKIYYFMSEELEEQEIVTVIIIKKEVINDYCVSN